MRMGNRWKKDKRGMGVVKTSIPVAAEPAGGFALSVLNCATNKPRIGDSRADRSAIHCRYIYVGRQLDRNAMVPISQVTNVLCGTEMR